MDAWTALPRQPSFEEWVAELRVASDVALARDREVLDSDADPIHPARVYGELLPRLTDDAVVIGDGGDFVSFAGRFVEPRRPGCWLDPGPYGCLGTGLGYAMAARIARPQSQVVLLLGDGAAGFSLRTRHPVRHQLPFFLSWQHCMWGLERPPCSSVRYTSRLTAPALRTTPWCVPSGRRGDPSRSGALGPAWIARCGGVPSLVN